LSNPGKYSNDNVICSLRFADGSQGTISYLANGDKSYSKERVEVFGGGAVAVLRTFGGWNLFPGDKSKCFDRSCNRTKVIAVNGKLSSPPFDLGEIPRSLWRKS